MRINGFDVFQNRGKEKFKDGSKTDYGKHKDRRKTEKIFTQSNSRIRKKNSSISDNSI